MLMGSKVENRILNEVMHIVVYIQNRCMLRLHESNTPYELWFSKREIMRHFKFFGNKCYMKRIEDHLGKFEYKAYKGIFNEDIFLGNSIKSKAYKCVMILQILNGNIV